MTRVRSERRCATSFRRRQIDEICGLLRQLGACGAQMTGSGSTVFGVFCDEEAAQAACSALKNRYPQTFYAKSSL